MKKSYIDATQEAGAALLSRHISGLVKQSSLASFMAFASNKEYLAGIGHRTPAVTESRLLPIVESFQNK